MPRLKLASITEVRRRISSNEISTEEYVVQCIEKIKNVSGEGAKAFLCVAQDEAIAIAQTQDILLEKGFQAGPLSGVTVSIKDLFDIAGQVTASGSNVLRNNSLATEDSEVVSRIRRAGGIVVGRTNMTEFAYSGLGLNPHFGTPLNPYDRGNGRIPGGSTSGGAISVTDQMAVVAIGSDTGGSCRIPAALCGIVGFKPTASRYSMAGVLPLSRSLDSVGVLAPTVQCCQIIDDVLFNGPKENNFEVSINRINIGVLENVVLEGIDRDVKKNYLRTIEVLERSGANLRTINSKVFERVVELQGQPKIVSAEANSEYENILTLKSEGVDPRVSTRIAKGKEITSAVYIQTLVERKLLIKAWQQEFSNDHVWVMPTVPIIAPLLNDLCSDEEYFKYNSLMLRNPGLINFLDGCALSIPNHFAEEPPTAIMLVSLGSADESLLRCGVAVEKALSTF